MNELVIKSDPISRADFIERFKNPGHGGQVFFFGIVRNSNHGRRVLGVSYDCFDALAVQELERISAEAFEKWGQEIDVTVVHRKGRVDVGEVSLAIGVSSRHRKESFEASRYLIEQLKIRLPIWKQEHYEEGDSAWLEGHALCDHA